MPRLLRIIFSIYLLALFGVYLPMHTRGMVAFVPQSGDPQAPRRDTPGQAESVASCCGSAGLVVESPRTGDDQPRGGENDRRRSPDNCAVCHLARGILPVAVFALDLAPNGRIDLPLLSGDSLLAPAGPLPGTRGCRDPPTV